jgi:glyoxylase-like metal-dependent hydrolase (beta-lactamase superfamily II)
MRVRALHEDVLVATSRIWQTTCTIVRGGVAREDGRGVPGTGEGFVIDSPILPDELDVLPAILEQSAFPLSGLLATHGDWDHLLARTVFAGASLGCAETTAARLTGAPGRPQRDLRRFDEEHYLQREQPLALGQIEALPVPGRLEVGDHELELHPADGHTADGMAVWIPFARVLVVGDYLSPVEVPMIAPGGSRSAYLATLARLEPLIAQADWIIPGHGDALDASRAQAVLREDRAYLEALPDAELPLARRTATQRAIHEANRERVA